MKQLDRNGLAEAMGVTASTVTGWEIGKSFPHFQVLLKLREFFEVNLESLVYLDLKKETAGKGGLSPLPDVAMLWESFEDLKARVESLEKKVGYS